MGVYYDVHFTDLQGQRLRISIGGGNEAKATVNGATLYRNAQIGESAEATGAFPSLLSHTGGLPQGR